MAIQNEHSSNFVVINVELVLGTLFSVHLAEAGHPVRNIVHVH